MAWNYEGKDGTVVLGIDGNKPSNPDEYLNANPDVKARVVETLTRLRASGERSGVIGGGTPPKQTQGSPTTKQSVKPQQATPEPASPMAATPQAVAQPAEQPGILDAPILPELAGTAPGYAESDRQMLAAGMSPEQVAQLRAMNPAPDQTPTTLAGLGGAVARGNPLTQTMGLVGDLANSAVTALGGKPIVLNPNDPDAASKPPSQQIQEYLTSLGVKDPASETEKFTELLANFMPMGSPAMSTKARAAFKPATGELAQMVKESPVPMMTSDVFPPKGKAATTFQDLGEQNPLSGSAKARATQQDSRVKAVQDLFDRYNVDTAITVTDDVMADLLKTRGAEVKKWTDLKAGVVERADATGQMVPVDNTLATIDSEIARLKGINNRQLDPAIAELEGFGFVLSRDSLFLPTYHYLEVV